MVPFFKTLFANTFQGFIATKEVYLYVHRERHVLPHIPTCYISSVYSFFSFYCFPFQIVFLYLKMKLLTMDTIVFDQSQTRPTVVSHLLAKDCGY